MDSRRYASYVERKWVLVKTKDLPKFDRSATNGKMLGVMGSQEVESALDRGVDVNRFILVDVEQLAAGIAPIKGGFYGGDVGTLEEDWLGYKAGTLILVVYVDGTFGGEPGSRYVNEWMVAVEVK